MQIRVGDSTFRASQLEKCWKAMQERAAQFDIARYCKVGISNWGDAFTAIICTVPLTLQGDDSDSPFSALASCIRNNTDQFRAWGIEVEDGK